ncbi:MAG: EamA family transporter [Desulfuromonas sp.]|nr:MAG: EamA family transporter [Desulfuromonas sp.]
MTQQRLALLYGLLAVLCWSTVASAFKLSLRYLTPAELLFYAALVSLIILFIILLIQGKAGQLKRVKRSALLTSFGLGFINPFLYYLVLFKAYDLLPAQQAQPINYTWAITLTLLSIPLLKQKISLRELLAVAVSYAGVVVISTRGDLLAMQFDSPLGVGLALLSTLFWALYWIYNTRSQCDPVVGLFLNFLFGLPLVGLYLLLTEGFRMPPLSGLLGAGYVGLFEMGITFVLWLKALKLSVNTARIANLIFISPFLSLVFIRFLVGEEILPATFIGLVLIVAGLVLQQTGRPGGAQERVDGQA